MLVQQFVAFTHNIRRVCTYANVSPNNMALFNRPIDRSAHTQPSNSERSTEWTETSCEDIARPVSLLINTQTSFLSHIVQRPIAVAARFKS